MTQAPRSRRSVDIVIAAAIAVAVLAAIIVVYLGSDVRATTLDAASPADAPSTPVPASAAPSQLRQVWQLTTDDRYGAVVTPYGTVATADEHSVRGFNALDGALLWTYTRSNRDLCAIGSGDSTADKLDSWTGVHGVMSVFAKNGYCSQVTLLDPSTGDRQYQRTSPNQDPGQLFFGSPYAGWMGSDYLELWRHDLVATIRYGNQANPVNASGPHLGCTFSDAAVTSNQLATIEHCGSTTNLVLNWPTPSDATDKGDKDWDANKSVPKTTVNLNSDQAVLLKITADRAAVLVAQPAPAVVIYDNAGVEISRTAVDIEADEILSSVRAGITPSVSYAQRQYTLVGRTLFALSTATETVPAPPPAESGDTAEVDDGAPGDAGAVASADSDAPPATVNVESPVLDWSMPGVSGLPGNIGGDLLAPTSNGLALRSAAEDRVVRTLPDDRGGYTGRVDVTAVGDIVVEVRGATVVGLAPGSGS